MQNRSENQNRKEYKKSIVQSSRDDRNDNPLVNTHRPGSSSRQNAGT